MRYMIQPGRSTFRDDQMDRVDAVMTPGSDPSPTRHQSPRSESLSGVASEREVRTGDATEYVMVNASNQRCQNCKKDRQKCTRTDPSQVKCDRCVRSGYSCTVDGVDAPPDGKRRRLQRMKCETCRSAKVKCTPEIRAWPDKCNRCKKNNFPCSEPKMSNNKRSQIDGRAAQTPQDAEEESDKSDESDEASQEVPIRNRPSAGPRTPARIPIADPIKPVQPIRPMRTTRRSLSDVVEDIYPPKSDYKYTPLKNDEIRLLVVHPGSPDQEIMCFLVQKRLQDCEPYQALSYRWGEDVPNRPVMILSYKPASKSKTFRDFKVPKIYTRSNLFEALQQLRQPHEKITLYVNALCINHDDPDEEHAQASRTQEIFNHASDVIVWLGTETPTSKTAFEFIPQVLNMNDFDELVKEGSNNQCWDALVDLMRNPLFSRRWLIQELAVAKMAALQCGPHIIQWTDFSDAIALFEANLPAIQRYSKFSLASGGPINDIRALGASTLVSVVNNIIRKTSDGKILNRLESMETLISLLAVFEAAKPLDTIISVIGLARDGILLKPKIDNSKEVQDNYIDFVKYCINSSRSIDIICRHWAPVMKENKLTYMQRTRGVQPSKTKLPSWIPNVSGSAFGAPEDKNKDKQSGRVHGDSFVGLPNHKIYNASRGLLPAMPEFGKLTNQSGSQQQRYNLYDGTLTVEGIVVARITELGPRASSGIIFQECLEMGGWDPSSNTVPERLWRTLVADRGPNNTNPPSWYHRACLHCLEQAGGTNNGDINTGALLNQPNCTHIVADFLRRVQSVIWNRKFFLCERPGRTGNGVSSGTTGEGSSIFGLVPGGTRTGDLLCVLNSCSVPVVLREHITAENVYFEVIGESFVYGMMDGEALEGLSREEIAKKDHFNLR